MVEETLQPPEAELGEGEILAPEAAEGEKETAYTKEQVEAAIAQATQEARARQSGEFKRAEAAEKSARDAQQQLQSVQAYYDSLLQKQLESIPDEDKATAERDFYKQRLSQLETERRQYQAQQQALRQRQEAEDYFDQPWIKVADRLGVKLDDPRVDWAYDSQDFGVRTERRMASFLDLQQASLEDKMKTNLSEEKRKRGFDQTEPSGIGTSGSNEEFWKAWGTGEANDRARARKVFDKLLKGG